MKFYKERNSLLDEEFRIDLESLKEYFYKIYRYFENMDAFEVAFKGVEKEKFGQQEIILPVLMAPSPEIYFLNHLKKENMFPIRDAYEDYSEDELFTIIEMLYDNIGKYDWVQRKFVQENLKSDFATQINSLLKLYGNGFMLETEHGIVMEIPNEALDNLMKTDIPESMSNETLTKLRTAVRQYYKYNSNEEEAFEIKKKAIALVADILESVRTDLQNLLNEEYEVNKNKHDKLIFDIVNEFNIRHDNQRQKTEYSKDIWYDWMMQYYTSIILTYYRLLEKQKNLI